MLRLIKCCCTLLLLLILGIFLGQIEIEDKKIHQHLNSVFQKVKKQDAYIRTERAALNYTEELRQEAPSLILQARKKIAGWIDPAKPSKN